MMATSELDTLVIRGGFLDSGATMEADGGVSSINRDGGGRRSGGDTGIGRLEEKAPSQLSGRLVDRTRVRVPIGCVVGCGLWLEFGYGLCCLFMGSWACLGIWFLALLATGL